MIMWQFFSLSLVFPLIVLLSGILSSNTLSILWISGLSLDSFGSCLVIIPVFIMCCVYFNIINSLNNVNVLLIILSCLSSVICFYSENYLLFFISYETSIILLLFSLFIGSSYSERCLAGWYFLGYLVLGGIPLLLVCLYLSEYSSIISNELSNSVSYIIFLLFITKVPLFPFHSWLPIVHAEANSYVSICLSGYIMKLGLLGIIRMVSISNDIIKLYSIVFFIASCFFFISCFCELDNKRWLAFLSLGHISVGMVGTLSLSNNESYLLGTFSLGHALSVIFLFFYFNMKINSLGSRNWVILINNNNNSMLWVIIAGLLSLIAFPPSILFFNEVFIFISTTSVNSLNSVFYLYILLSILAPISMAGIILSRLSSSSGISDNMLDNSVLILTGYLFYSYFLII